MVCWYVWFYFLVQPLVKQDKKDTFDLSKPFQIPFHIKNTKIKWRQKMASSRVG